MSRCETSTNDLLELLGKGRHALSNHCPAWPGPVRVLCCISTRFVDAFRHRAALRAPVSTWSPVMVPTDDEHTADWCGLARELGLDGAEREETAALTDKPR